MFCFVSSFSSHSYYYWFNFLCEYVNQEQSSHIRTTPAGIPGENHFLTLSSISCPPTLCGFWSSIWVSEMCVCVCNVYVASCVCMQHVYGGTHSCVPTHMCACVCAHTCVVHIHRYIYTLYVCKIYVISSLLSPERTLFIQKLQSHFCGRRKQMSVVAMMNFTQISDSSRRLGQRSQQYSGSSVSPG